MENLDLYERLQKVFREKMGPEQIGDRIFDTRDNMVGFIASIDGNRLDYITGNAYWTMKWEVDRLPLPIDPVNPERGLLGMLNGIPHLWKATDKWCLRLVAKNQYLECKSPTEALLRALCTQEGV